MQVIIYTNDLGGVSVCYPTGELDIEAVKAKDIPPIVVRQNGEVISSTPRESFIVDADTLPNADNDFFDAWELNGETVSVNIDKAKELTKTRLRAEREPLLTAQDVLFMKNLEAGLDNSAVVAEKQRLRDITNLVDACTTTVELRALKVEA